MRFDLRKRLFLDRRHNDLISLRPRRVEHEKRKTSVACDETEFGHSEKWLVVSGWWTVSWVDTPCSENNRIPFDLRSVYQILHVADEFEDGRRRLAGAKEGQFLLQRRKLLALKRIAAVSARVNH